MRPFSRLLFALCVPLYACDAIDDQPADLGDDPIGDYDSLMMGAPDNDTLPDDNKADAQYPKKFDLVADQSPVRNQASRGVCSIFSTVALMENLYIKAGQPMPDFSEQYLQWAVKVKSRQFTSTGGSNASANLATIHQYGIPVETAWPYETSPWTASNDPACTGGENLPTRCYTNGEPPAGADAQVFKLPAGRFVNTNSIKAHIFGKKSGVIVGLDFFYQAWAHGRSPLPISQDYRRMGVVIYPNAKDIEESHKMRAGHSILLVGWDDDFEVPLLDEAGNPLKDAQGNVVMEKGFYIFKNSWGTGTWSSSSPIKSGYGLISMRYVARYGSAYASDVPDLGQPPPPPPPTSLHGEAAPNAPIPDDDPTGLSSTIGLTATGKVTKVTVKVDIAHTYVGDLTVVLEHGGKTVTLQAEQGGSDDNLVKSFTPADFNDSDKGGSWKLTVTDGAAQDTGTLRNWSIDLQ